MKKILAGALYILLLGSNSYDYSIIDLGNLGSQTRALSINNHGQVVGYYRPVPDTGDRGFYWDSTSGMIDVGDLVGDSGTASNVRLDGINISGEAAGFAKNLSTQTKAIYWNKSSGMTELDILEGQQSWGEDINDSGIIVGEAGGTAFIRYSDGSVVDLGTLAPNNSYYSHAYAINNGNQVVGVSSLGYIDNIFTNTSFLWDSSNGMVDLGFGSGSIAFDINNNGQIVGTFYLNYPDSQRAFLWDNKSSINLGYIGDHTTAYAINDNGQVVGASGGRAFVWDSINKMKDLNSLINPSTGWTLIAAYDINELGQIVGYGYNRLGEPHAFLLEPNNASSSGAIW